MNDEISQIREFNRFYTVHLGLLNRNFLNSEFTFPEGRVLQIIYENPGVLPSQVVSRLHIDKSYMSRILKSLEIKKCVRKVKSANDARAVNLYVSSRGKGAYEDLDRASVKQLGNLLKGIGKRDRKILVDNMTHIKRLLSDAANPKK